MFPLLFLGLVVSALTASIDNNDVYSVLHGDSFVAEDPWYQCPDAEDISPCLCEKQCEKCNAVIHCSNITNVDQLNDVFERSKDFPFRMAQFYDMSIPYFPAKSLETKQFRKLFIVNSTLVSLFDEPPSSNSLLQEIYLKNIQLQRSIEWELFSSFKELFNIEIVNSTLNKVTNLAGEHLPKQLSKIHLERTKTNTIADNAFAGLKQLSSIHITENEITTIKRSMFPSPFIGTQINLWDNKIETLPDDFLENMPQIVGLGLQNNSLTTVSESVFGDHPSSLRAIFFEGNPINCDCDMKWLTQRKMIYLEGECVSPNKMKGKYLSELKASDFSYC